MAVLAVRLLLAIGGVSIMLGPIAYFALTQHVRRRGVQKGEGEGGGRSKKCADMRKQEEKENEEKEKRQERALWPEDRMTNSEYGQLDGVNPRGDDGNWV